MQSPQTRLSQSFSVLIRFDAIQQDDRRIACPDSTDLWAESRSHAKARKLRTDGFARYGPYETAIDAIEASEPSAPSKAAVWDSVQRVRRRAEQPISVPRCECVACECVPSGSQRFRLVGRAEPAAARLTGVIIPPGPEPCLPFISTVCQQCWAPLIRSLEMSLTPTLPQSARGGRVSKGDVAWLAAGPIPGSRLAAMVFVGNREAPPACGQGLLRISV